MKQIASSLVLLGLASTAHGLLVDTTNAGTVASLQSGATVTNFESIPGRAPQAISAYTSSVAVSPNAFVFDQIPGVQFSVGGMVGVNRPALFSLGGAMAGDAKSPPYGARNGRSRRQHEFQLWRDDRDLLSDQGFEGRLLAESVAGPR